MTTPDQKRQAIQDQVNSKIHWDSPEYEVLEWLADKHGIRDEDASRMLAIAAKKRTAAIRGKALWSAVFAGIGLAISGTFLWMEWVGGYFYLISTIIAGIVFFANLVWLQLSLLRLFSGKTDTTIDH